MIDNNYYIVSSRKYRPLKLNDIVGQEFITNTLKIAIKNDNLAHALLFSGPSGVGKTTCARIISKELNKPYLNNKDSDLDLDIFELDAASNNSVDDIRNINEKIFFSPKIGKYKIYIIDEVHMLSQSAFNAFLKILEEPPLHVKFILATTEKYKIPSTVLSRCQIYEFKNISIDNIVSYLKKISLYEKVNIDYNILLYISQKCNGSLRSALSMFDQIISYKEKKEILYKKDIINLLGILDNENYFLIIDNIIYDIHKTILLYNNIIDSGYNTEVFINELTIHFRNLLISKDIKTKKLLKFDIHIQKKYIIQSKKINTKFLLKILDICYQTQINYRFTKNYIIYTELFLIKIYNLINKN